jgi:hypothetical protein
LITGVGWETKNPGATREGCQADSANMEKRCCAYCESKVTESSKFLRVEAGRVGDTPVVLAEKKHFDSEFMCLEHWLANKQRY